MARELTHSGPVLQRLAALAFGGALTAFAVAALDLSVFEAMDDEPSDVADLARRLEVDRAALNRLLRVLATHGIVEQVTPQRYRHTDLSRLLDPTAAGSAADMLRMGLAQQGVEKLAADAVRTGRSMFAQMHGKNFFAHLAEDQGAADVFNRTMTGNMERDSRRLVDLLDLSGDETVADIGGGRGQLLRALLRRWPGLDGILFDLRPVVDTADPELRAGGRLAGRCALVAGDCQESVPVVADVYLLKNVLHMWDDDTGVRVLRNIAAVAPEGARVILVEQLLYSGGPYEATGTLLDMIMLSFLGGKERTEPEFAELFTAAGLSFRGATQIDDGLIALIEGRASETRR
ncbi:methyltransferase [Streptomyces sp. B1866]|uniref:methyltransferase n=1 Tax=Streptomyces sp. B1866 TaxID=3075431 RepID=UPI0028912082|nr:methyltransferase [Streptomyces sp. B1866]MDT3399573.1 methyltransferase [Streptomyces sp. B1866]